MPFQVPEPDVQEFILRKTDIFYRTDEEHETRVSVRKATVREDALRGELFSEYIREVDIRNPQIERVVMKMPMYKLAALEVYLTLAACNITSDGKAELFSFHEIEKGRSQVAMKRAEFFAKWGLLPDLVASEIHEFVIQQNPQWEVSVSEVGESSLGE